MARNEYTVNLQLAAAAHRAHVGAHFAKRGPARRPARRPVQAPIRWRRIAFAVATAAPVLASIIIRFA